MNGNDVVWNQNGGLYKRGKRYDIIKKQTVAVEYLSMRVESGSEKVNITEIAKRARVSWKYAKKVVTKYEQTQQFSDPGEEKKNVRSDII